MNSQQTESNEKRQVPEGWKAPVEESITKYESSGDGLFDVDNPLGDVTVVEDRKDSNNTTYSQQTEQTEVTQLAVSKRTSGKQRKESLDEYREAFLQVPKLNDRKPVFVSCEVRDRLDEIVRKLGGRKMSVSGFIENLAVHHLETYHEDFKVWRKL